VVWHGFTQMAAYAGNSPITVERAEGREVIDVDGRRYFDAISSLWVMTLGHHVPELDVMPSQVIDSTDGGLPPESGVAAVMIVEMQE